MSTEIREHDKGCSALNATGFRRCNCSRRAEDQERDPHYPQCDPLFGATCGDQERGGVTVDVEAIRGRLGRVYAAETREEHHERLDDLEDDIPQLLNEVVSLRAQLAQRDEELKAMRGVVEWAREVNMEGHREGCKVWVGRCNCGITELSAALIALDQAQQQREGAQGE